MTQTGNFEFYDNYSESAQKLQPELYDEIRNILNREFTLFYDSYNRKPIVMDIGSAGLLPYDLSLIKQLVLLDIFKKPEALQLGPNCEWIIGDILSANYIPQIQGYGKFDFIIMSSLLHHLCHENNGIIINLKTCFFNSSLILSDKGKICIFESTCPKFLTKIEDFFYPIYSKILKDFFKFTYVRMLSVDEIILTLRNLGLETIIVPFKQPRYIAQMYWSIPTKFYPLKIHTIFANLNRIRD